MLADAFSKAHNEFSCPTVVTLAISFFSTMTALIIALVNFILFIRTEAKRNLLSRYEKLVQIQIDNPHFENDSYINDIFYNYYYNQIEKSSFVAYNRYCSFLFNFIKDLWVYCKKDINKMNKIIICNDYFQTHKRWIDKNSNYIIKSYSNEFHSFIKEQQSISRPGLI